MTKKRFIVDVAYDELVMIMDNGNETDLIFSYNDKDTVNEVVGCLNALHEENEQLKGRNKKRLQRLKNQRKGLEKQQRAIWGYKGDIKQLKEENEQLKKELNAFKPIIFEDANNRGSSILYEKVEE